MDPNLPSDCPVNEPIFARACPMQSRDFIERMKSIEDDIKKVSTRIDEDQKLRHERNATIASVIDEERLERIKLEDLVKENAESLGELIAVVKGSWRDTGMFAQLRDINDKIDHWSDKIQKIDVIDERLGKLESSRILVRGAISGGTLIISFIGSVIGAAITAIGMYFNFKN